MSESVGGEIGPGTESFDGEVGSIGVAPDDEWVVAGSKPSCILTGSHTSGGGGVRDYPGQGDKRWQPFWRVAESGQHRADVGSVFSGGTVLVGLDIGCKMARHDMMDAGKMSWVVMSQGADNGIVFCLPGKVGKMLADAEAGQGCFNGAKFPTDLARCIRFGIKGVQL